MQPASRNLSTIPGAYPRFTCVGPPSVSPTPPLSPPQFLPQKSLPDLVLMVEVVLRLVLTAANLVKT